MLAHGKFIAFKNLFFSFRWIISWNSVPGLLRAVFHFATEIEEGQSKKLSFLANFWSARTPFLAAFAGLARWAQVGYFPFAESGKLPRWAIEATRLGCEPWLRGRKFPDDSPRQLTGNPPRAAQPTIQRDLPQNDRLCSPTNHIGTPRSANDSPTTHIFLKTIQLRPWSRVFLVTLIQGQEEVQMLYVYYFASVPYLPC